MKLKQDGCDICGDMQPLKEMFFGYWIHDLCEECYNWVASRGGE